MVIIDVSYILLTKTYHGNFKVLQVVVVAVVLVVVIVVVVSVVAVFTYVSKLAVPKIAIKFTKL